MSPDKNIERTLSAVFSKSHGWQDPLLSLPWAGSARAVQAPYPSAMALPGTLVDTKDAHILTSTVKADLQESRANMSVLPEARARVHTHTHVHTHTYTHTG